jgi:hypothetical protein
MNYRFWTTGLLSYFKGINRFPILLAIPIGFSPLSSLKTDSDIFLVTETMGIVFDL